MGCANFISQYMMDVDVYDLAEMADPTKIKMRSSLRLGGVLGFVGGFLMAYQRSSCELFHCLARCYIDLC